MDNAENAARKHFFLHPGAIIARREAHVITTVLGSCISVCLWDPALKAGGMNHYQLPLWNGEGLPSPKYGNVAIPALIERMLAMGCRKENLKAKVFGGMGKADAAFNVGERNARLALDVLYEQDIPIISSDVCGELGRKIIFHTDSGSVLVKKIKPMAHRFDAPSAFCARPPFNV